jgi:hypothetical protein
MSEHSAPVDPAGTANARTAPPPSRAAAPLRATVAEAMAAPIPAGRTSALLMAHGRMRRPLWVPVVGPGAAVSGPLPQPWVTYL